MLEADEYYILNIRGGTGNLVLFWGPNNSGYTVDVSKAGRYTAAQVAARPWYYDDGDDTKAVPCKLVDEAACPVVLAGGEVMQKWGPSTTRRPRRAARGPTGPMPGKKGRPHDRRDRLGPGRLGGLVARPGRGLGAVLRGKGR